jgi:hypothetical protein
LPLAEQGDVLGRRGVLRCVEGDALTTEPDAVDRPAAVEDAGAEVAEGVVRICQRLVATVEAEEGVLDDVLGG